MARWSSGLGRWPFKPEITGSIPVRATTFFEAGFPVSGEGGFVFGEVFGRWFRLGGASLFGRVAQLVRAPALQAGGRQFESVLVHHFPSWLSLCRAGIFFCDPHGDLTVVGYFFYRIEVVAAG